MQTSDDRDAALLAAASAADHGATPGSLLHRRQLQQTTRAMEQQAARFLSNPTRTPSKANPAVTSSSKLHHQPRASPSASSSEATLALVALAAAHSTASLASPASASASAVGPSPPHLRAEPLSWSELQGRNLDSTSARRAAVSILGVASDHAEARRRPPPTVDFDAQEPGHGGTTTTTHDQRAATREHEEARRRVLASGIDFEAQEPGHADSSHSSSMRESAMLAHLQSQQLHTPRRRHDSTPLASSSSFASPSVPMLSPSSVLLGVGAADLRSPSTASSNASLLSHRSARRSHSHGEQSSAASPPNSSGSRSCRRSGSGVLLSPMRNPMFTERGAGSGDNSGRSRITEEEKGDDDDPNNAPADSTTAAAASTAASPPSVNQRVLDYFMAGAGAALWHSFATQMTREDAARLLAAVSATAATAAAPPSSSAATATAGGPRSPRSPVSLLSSSLKRSASLSVSTRSAVVPGALIPVLDPTSSLESLHACCASLLAQVPPRRFTGAASLAPLLREMQKERRAILQILNSGRLLSIPSSSHASPKQWILRDVHQLIASTALVGSQGQCISEPRLLRLLSEWSAESYKYDSLEEIAQVILMVHKEVPKAAVLAAPAAAKQPTAMGTARGQPPQQSRHQQRTSQASTALSSPKTSAPAEEKSATSTLQAVAPPPAATSSSPIHSATIAPPSPLAASSASGSVAAPVRGVSSADVIDAAMPPPPPPQSQPPTEPNAVEVALPTTFAPPTMDPPNASGGSAPVAPNVIASPKQQQQQTPPLQQQPRQESVARSPSRVVLEQASSAIHALRAASPRGESRSISPFSAARFDALPQRLYEGVDGVWRDARGLEEVRYRAHMQTKQQATAIVCSPSNPTANRQPLLPRRPTVQKQAEDVAV